MTHFRPLTPDGERNEADEISIDLERFEAELAATMAAFDAKSGHKPSPEKSAELKAAVGPLDLPEPRAPRSPAVAPRQTPEPASSPAPAVVSPASATAATPAKPANAGTGTAPEFPTINETASGIDLLSELRIAAEQKAKQNTAADIGRKIRAECTETAMRRMRKYLSEISGHLNKIQPPVPQYFRPLPNVELSAMHWEESFIDFRTLGGTEISPLETLSLRYTLSTGKQLRVEKLPNFAPAYHEELKRVGLRFTATEQRSSRGMVEQVNFLIDRAISVSLQFKAKPETQTISLHTRNFVALSGAYYLIDAADVDQEFLDALGNQMLGRANDLFERMIKTPTPQ